jgi:hypothetical protein
MAVTRARCQVDPLRSRVSLGFDLVDQLIELVQIDAVPEAKRVRNSPRCCMATRLGLFAKAGAKRTVDYLLERNAEFAGAPLQEAGKIVIDRQCGPHRVIMDVNEIDVKTSRQCPF